MRYSFKQLVLVPTVLLMAIGCKQDGAARVERSSGETSALNADIFVAEAPADAVEVSQIKADANASGEVVVHGRIGGRRDPFVDGAAVFVLIDTALKPCNARSADLCQTPWDYCCETPESLRANSATIQLVDDGGKPLRVDVKGHDGLKPLAELTIDGEVVQQSADGALVINARRIYVHPRSG